eukprot:6371425-Ditylum_brightwellii.AAC.1
MALWAKECNLKVLLKELYFPVSNLSRYWKKHGMVSIAMEYKSLSLSAGRTIPKLCSGVRQVGSKSSRQ